MKGGEDAQRFAALMARLGVAFDQAVTAQRIGIYAEALQDQRIEALEWAVKEAIKRSEFFPRAKLLLELARMAPPPPRARVGAGAPVALIPDLLPVEEQRRRMAELVATLNGRFGTSFEVSEGRGRPELVSAREEGL